MYQKPQQIKDFETAYFEKKYSGKLAIIPQQCRVKKLFRDDTANELTKLILAHLEYTNNFGARINTGGIYDKKRGVYRYSGSQRGMADISAIINGKAVQIEIKAGKDKPREMQIKVQKEYQRAGGIYEFIHNFAEYIELFNKIQNNEI